MIYGILSDIHSNLEALTTCLDYLQKEKIQKYIYVGDIVGYGPNPNECIEEIKKLSPLIVIGNHDAACCGQKDIICFNNYAQQAIVWTIKNLSDSNRDYLSGLPKTLIEENFLVVHGSPRDPIDEYILTELEFKENLSFFVQPICFIGHSHIPFVFSFNVITSEVNLILPQNGDIIKISPDRRYIINVGSVGQPRDDNPKSCCVVYDTEKGEIRYIRLSYNITETQNKMRKVKLPEFLIQRLSVGR